MVDSIASTNVSSLVMSKAMTLDEKVAFLLQIEGGKKTLPSSIKVADVHNLGGLCGYNYWENDNLLGQIYLGSLVSGTYVILKKYRTPDDSYEEYDYYDANGNYFYSSSSLDGEIFTYGSITMDTKSPLLNHMYNVLYQDYEKTSTSLGHTQRIALFEKILNKFYRDEKFTIDANNGTSDRSLLRLSDEILRVERNKVLKWQERQDIFKEYLEVLDIVLNTKSRVHRKDYFTYKLPVKLRYFALRFKKFAQRPINNFFGTLYKLTLGNLFWFLNTVRSNLGYSIALAIYGPFTFYFITQPMNPHAMWAVGKVRKAYINVTTSLENPDKIRVTEASNDLAMIDDTVSTKNAAPIKENKTISWEDRMSNFKAMQIAYEGEMVFAARMGRIEQFETQFNFPLTAEAAWMEMELYRKKIDADLAYFKTFDPKYIAFLNNEKARTIEHQTYIWKKIGQFFIDHPYIVVDQDDEQTEKNYYTGRQFVFYKKMTETLKDLGVATAEQTHKKVSVLAKTYKASKIAGSSVLDNLKKNSKLFRQKDLLSSDEHRSYMKAQWETLFLQQNKKQEASSFALQAYTWSVRNAIWLLQSIYSAKRFELNDMNYKFNMDNTGTYQMHAKASQNEYLENMYHNLVMEYVGIRKEMLANLPGDNEAKLRENVIYNIKQYLIERDELFNGEMFAATEEDKVQI